MTPDGELRALGTAIGSRLLSPTEHVADVLDRLSSDPYNVVVTLDAERALERAAALTRELAAGRRRGPLHGIAVGVKDLFDVAGLPTHAGSALLADAPPATADAPVVTRLVRAGAVVVAKLHTHEFAYGPTGDVAATGPARNPHAPDRITGGSSSGSAAAVAAGHLPLALGTDTGGSVRIPAALCGVVGLKPTLGRLPTERVFGVSETCDHVGLLTADADSAAVAWEVLATATATADADGGAAAAGVEGLLVGVPVDDYWSAADPVLARGATGAAEVLRQRGARIVEVRTPMIEELAAAYGAIVGAEAYATHRPWLDERPGDYQPATRMSLEPFAEQPAREYVTALRTRRRLSAMLRRAVGDVDVLVLPTTRLRATPIGAPFVHIGGQPVPVGPALLELTLPFNLTGWPAVSVPQQPADGLPVGVQLVGIRTDEHRLLRIAMTLADRRE